MTEERITVKIDGKGFITVSAKGMEGPACVDGVTSLLREIAVITEIDKTDEYYGTTKQKSAGESGIETKGRTL